MQTAHVLQALLPAVTALTCRDERHYTLLLMRMTLRLSKCCCALELMQLQETIRYAAFVETNVVIATDVMLS